MMFHSKFSKFIKWSPCQRGRPTAPLKADVHEFVHCRMGTNSSTEVFQDFSP